MTAEGMASIRACVPENQWRQSSRRLRAMTTSAVFSKPTRQARNDERMSTRTVSKLGRAGTRDSLSRVTKATKVVLGIDPGEPPDRFLM